jgi:FkbM family methyltransferase|tara:strand:- start:25 stop:882 length:858 start_codon:yes stop_codon:yes gene_type:complete
MGSKYLSSAAYIRKARLVVARLILSLGVPLINRTVVGNYSIKFVTTNFVEYFLRAEESYTREVVTMLWIQKYIKAGDVVYDVGANVGAYSLLMGKILSASGGCVYAFEPGAANFFALNRNIHANQLSDTVLAFPLAFGDTHRISRFYLTDINSGAARHAIDTPESDRENFTPQHVQGVLIESIDKFANEAGVKFPNHIKIDVDGVETAIIQNSKSVLSDRRLKSLMIEIETVLSDGEIEQIMAEAGFVEVDREQWGDRTIFNVLFVRKEFTYDVSRSDVAVRKDH